MFGALMLRMRFPQFCEAVSRKDVDAACRDIGEDVVFEFPGQSSISGRYDGRPAFRAYWLRLFDRYDTFTMTPKRIALARPYAFGLTNTVLMEWVVDVLANDGLSLRAEGVTVVEIRHGKAVHVRDYIFDPTLLELVWGKRKEEQGQVATGTVRPA